jgi:hypothetical protein
VKLTKNEAKYVKIFLLFSILFMFSMQMGWLSAYGINPMQIPTGDPQDPIDPAFEVYTKVYTRTLLDESTADLIVNMYDASGNFLDTCTTSSGVGTFSGQYRVGQVVYLQARQAAPATATEYISALTAFKVPTAGESADTVTLVNSETGQSIFWLRDVAASAITLQVQNSSGYTLGGTSAYNYTDAEGSTSIKIIITDADDFYGGHDFIDYDTADHDEWVGGIWVVLRSNLSDDAWADTYTTFGTPSYMYYVWHFDTYLFKETGSSLDRESLVFDLSLTGSATFTVDQAMVWDVFDLCQIIGGGITSIGQFEDGGGTSVAANTTYVA